MRGLGIAVVGLALVLALAACTRTEEKVLAVTPSPASTPTLTAETPSFIDAYVKSETFCPSLRGLSDQESWALFVATAQRNGTRIEPIAPPLDQAIGAMLKKECQRLYPAP